MEFRVDSGVNIQQRGIRKGFVGLVFRASSIGLEWFGGAGSVPECVEGVWAHGKWREEGFSSYFSMRFLQFWLTLNPKY